jgi:tetratricopeptide (TPR) repeat protein
LTHALQRAAALYGAGDLRGAEQVCRQTLADQAECCEALNLLGIIAARTGRPAEAARLLERAVAARPHEAALRNNYGNVLRDLGRHAAALESYDQALQLEPGYAEAHFNRGALLAQSQRCNEALASFERALAIQPRHVEAHNNRGVILQDLGRFADAVASYSRALELRPDLAEARYNRANAWRALGRRAEALADYTRVLDLQPQFAAAWRDRGQTLHELQRFEEALASFERALTIQPGHAGAHSGRGIALCALERFEEALASFDRALELRPDYAEAWNNRGIALRELQRLEEALASYQRALDAKSDYPEAHNNRGVALQRMRRFAEALASFDRALELRPDYPDAHYNRGIALRSLERPGEALASYDRALQLRPEDPGVLLNRSVLLYDCNQLQAALEGLNRALAGRPDFAAAYFNRALAYLKAGNFAQGWADYEWRWRAGAQPEDRLEVEQPLWLGAEPLAGRTILLHCEQGFGDTLQFCRYAKLVAALGASVVLRVPRRLARLLGSLEGVAQLVARDEPLPAFDYHCPLLSLPLALRTTLETIPAHVPYLSADAHKARYWRERLGSGGKLRVGLVWSGGFRPHRPETWDANRRRSIPLRKLEPLRHVGIEFYSLQKGEPAESELAEAIAAGWDGLPLINCAADQEDFSDTAAIMVNLDLILSVDTATAHLAGALGKPVWIMTRFDNDWRWLLDRTDSPWYPTARLYRQETPGDWDGVVARIRSDLVALLAARPTCV